jgi:hypothetical protein
MIDVLAFETPLTADLECRYFVLLRQGIDGFLGNLQELSDIWQRQDFIFCHGNHICLELPDYGRFCRLLPEYFLQSASCAVKNIAFSSTVKNCR